jgi:hypothetical protein
MPGAELPPPPRDVVADAVPVVGAASQRVLTDEDGKHAFTDVAPQPEQALCLAGGQPQARHLFELRENPANEALARADVAAVRKLPYVWSSVH